MSRQQQANAGWCQVPHAYFKRLFAVFTHTEMAILGNILDNTVGRAAPKSLIDVGGTPWCEIRQAEFARYAGVSADWVSRILARLIECGAIEAAVSPRDKRMRIYRCNTADWQSLVPRAARNLRPKWDAENRGTAEDVAGDNSAAEAPEASAAEQMSFIFVPGRGKLKVDEVLCKSCVGKLHGMANKEQSEVAKPQKTEDCRKKIPEVESGYSSKGLNAKLESQPEIKPSYFTEVRQALNARLESQLGKVTDRIVGDVVRSGVPLPALLARIDQRSRLFSGPKRSWGGVVLLVEELAAAQRHAPPPPVEEPPPDNRAQVEAIKSALKMDLDARQRKVLESKLRVLQAAS